jgi:hypothetical protein
MIAEQTGDIVTALSLRGNLFVVVCARCGHARAALPAAITACCVTGELSNFGLREVVPRFEQGHESAPGRAMISEEDSWTS